MSAALDDVCADFAINCNNTANRCFISATDDDDSGVLMSVVTCLLSVSSCVEVRGVAVSAVNAVTTAVASAPAAAAVTMSVMMLVLTAVMAACSAARCVGVDEVLERRRVEVMESCCDTASAVASLSDDDVEDDDDDEEEEAVSMFCISCKGVDVMNADTVMTVVCSVYEHAYILSHTRTPIVCCPSGKNGSVSV